MGQLRRFLGIFVSLFIIAIAGNAHAAGYTCDSIKQYTSCVNGRYLNSTAVGNNCDSLCTNATAPANQTNITYNGSTVGTKKCSGKYTGGNGSDCSSTNPATCCTGCSEYTCTCTGDYYVSNQGSSSCSCVPNNHSITLNNNTGTGGSGTIYTTHATNVYSDSARSKAMTTSANAVTKPTKSGVTVTYNANNGSVSPTSASTSYTFNGYYSATSGGTQYIASTGYITSSGLTAGKALTANGTWYAQWTCNSVTLPTPTRAGYKFNGWYTASSGGNKVGDAGAPYCPTSATTIYAQWTPSNYSITLNNQSATSAGTGTIYTTHATNVYLDSTRSNAMTSSANKITTPTKNGGKITYNANNGTVSPSSVTSSYTFNGYYSATSGGTQYIAATGYITSNGLSTGKNLTANDTWYAHWTCATKLPTPTRTGYTFNGWYTATSGGTRVGGAGSSYCPTSATTIYAQWTPTVYAITLNNNNGTGGSGTVYEKYATGYSLTNFGTTVTSVTAPTRSGYTFRGYYSTQVSDLSANGSTGTQRVTKAGKLPSNTTFTSDTTIYAGWAKNCTTPSNGSCSLSVSDAGVVTYTTSCNTGYTISGNGTATPTCTANCIKITLNNTQNGGTGGTTEVYKRVGSTTLYSNSTCSTTLSAITKPSKTNATYGGHYNTSAASGGTQCITTSGTWSSSCNPTSATTIYAQYDCNSDWRENGTRIAGTCIGTIRATSSDKSKNYDGSALTCNGVTVTAPTSGATIKYGTVSGTYNLTAAPTVTNVADTKTIYYQITATNYATKTGSFKCTINRATGSISAIADQTLTYPTTKNVTVTRSGDGTVSASSSDTSVATVSVSGTTLTLTPKKYGTTTITVNVAQGSNHNAATPITFKVTVNRGNCTVTLSSTSSEVTYPTNPATFTATVSNNVAFNTPVTSNPSAVTVTISNGTVTPVTKGAGSATITISTAQTEQYNSCSATHTVKVNKAPGQVVINPTSGSIAYRPGAASATTVVTTNTGGGTISATSNNTNITTGVGSDGKTITITSNGKVLSNATVTVTSAATTNYNSASTTYTLSSVTCGTGYYNKSGTCTACPENATACGGTSNPDTFECDSGYKKNAAGDACEPAEYTVTYNCGTGTGTPPTETTKPKYNASTGYTPKDNTCTKAGYDFAGWLVSGTTNDIRDAGTKFIWKYTENKTFTAQWDPIGNYSATYSCGDGTGTAPARDTNITFNGSYTVKANGTSNCSRTGYTFAGWSDGSKTVQPGAITWTYTSSKTFTAIWTPKCLSITVNSQSATTNAAPATVYLKYATGWYSNSTCTTALSAFTTKADRTGYTFGGFYTGTTGTGTQVANTTGNGTFLTSATALKAYSAAGTMYAKWTVNTYTISYTLNGGTQASSGVPTSYTYGVGANINGKPTRANYLFAGWCTDSGLASCSMTQTINTTATGNKAFYAKWNGCPDHATCTNNTVTCDDNYDWNEATQTCILGMVECEEGKYYPGTGTAMVDCKKDQGWYCPGTGKVAIGGGAGCYVACPTSTNKGTLSTDKDNATKVTNCMESLTGVKIPKSSPTKNGTANTVCGYTSGTNGSASYEKDCSFTVTQCDAGYYVPVKSESPYSKQGTCEEVGKGFFRAAGTCNANPTKDNDTCMRIACPGTGTTSGNTSDAETQCYITCNTDTIRDGETAIGSKTPVKATLDYSGSAYPSCTYTLTCIEGYKKQGENTAAATCVPEVYTVTLNIGYSGGTNQAAIYAKHNHGWYSNNIATTSLSKITPPTRTNYTFGGYKDANDTLVIKSDGTFVNAKPTLTADTTLTAVWQGVPVTCVAGKYYTGTGTTMAPCRAGEYCPGDSDVNLPKAYQGTAGCYIKCPKSGLANSVLLSDTTDGTGATSINQCKESLTNIEIPKNSTTKNGTADTKCNYTSGTDGSAKYDTDCSFTVKSCIAGYYVPVKTESPYSKQGTCEEVGRGYYRTAGTCNANPTKDNDTCMRIACPDNGLTTGTKSTSKDACYKDCSKEDIMSNGKKIGERNPVTDAEGNSRAWLISGTNNYDVCYYNASCANGYKAEPKNSEAGSTNATCVVGASWEVKYDGENDYYKLTGNPIRNFDVETPAADRTLPTAANVVRTGYTFTGWYDNASLTGTKLTEIPSDRLSAITLYPAWAPKIYPVTVDHNNGTANQTIYLKYATGWYSDVNATSKLESLSIPDGSGDEFGGYYYNDDVEVVNASGKFMTNTLTPADNMKIVAVWISQPITCPAGTYYPGNGDITNCKPCESGYYCEGKTKCNSNDGKNYCGRTDCPEHTIVSVNISSTPGATNKTQCIKNNVPYVSDAKHVKSGSAHCPANESGVYNYDAALCTNHSVTTCVAGYYRDTDTAADACEAVGTGWWSDGSDTSRVQCESRPINTYTSDGVAPVVSTKPGTTTGTTSTSAQDCFLELVPFTPAGAHGKGTQTCKWNGFSDYDDHCSDKVIRYCDAGYYRKNVTDTECVPAGADRYSTEGSLISEQCPARIDATGEIKNGETAIAADTASGKVENASSPEACMLRVSYDVPHGTGTKLCEFNQDSVNQETGEKGQYDKNCNDRVITSCDGGYYRPLENGEAVTDACVEVGNNYYRAAGRCTGSGATDTCMRIACPENGLTTGTTSAVVTECYKTGLSYTSAAKYVTQGTQTCNANTAGQYTSGCRAFNVTKCAAGYYHGTSTAADSCEAVGIGWWSDGSSISRTQCETGTTHVYSADGVAPETANVRGTTIGATSTASTACYLENVPYTPENGHGKGTKTCNWDGFAAYANGCTNEQIRYCDAGYYRASTTAKACEPAGLNYYSPEGAVNNEICPARIDATGTTKNGETTTTTAPSPEACVLRVPYDVPHGTGTKLCEFNKDSVNSATGEKGQYDKNCSDRVITSCDGGYYRPLENGEAVTDACVEVGQNYWRAAGVCTGTGALDTCMRNPCPNNGLTIGTTSASSSLCYLEKVMCEVNHGRGEHMCYYNPTSTNYDTNCTTCNVTGCVDGYTEENGVCVLCPAGHICKDTPDGPSNETCATLTNNLYPKSDAGASDISMCYRDCALGLHATSMTGRDYYNNNQCKIAACEKGYILSDGKCQVCPAGHYCPTDNPDDQLECPADWSNSDGLATKKEDCYRSCESYPITGGTAVPVNEKAFWPNKCEYKGVSNNGNECDIVDDTCVEISCRNIYEMVNGVCVPCNREHALSYLPKGNCMVASCEIGYHPNGQSCEYDVKTCNVPHAYRASQKWDSKLNSFSTCQVEECEEGYHISSNACVADEQVCAVEHGVGIKEWNSRTNSWGECVATSCDAGYTNDPTETNERSKQCGQCKNKFSVLGELAASTYIRGCEIASCLYQGELYNLENNECVPICDVNGREDETGTMKWDASRKKCVRTCKEGYTMW